MPTLIFRCDLALGRNVTISSQYISTGNITTLSSDSKAGTITLVAPNGMDVGLLYASSDTDKGGNVSLSSNTGTINTSGIFTFGKTSSGKIDVSGKNNIDVGRIYSATSNGSSKPISITSTTGSITAQGIYSGASGNGGDIQLIAPQGISSGYIFSPSNTGNGGDIQLTSTLGGISVGGIGSGSYGGKGGNINVTSGGAIYTGESSVSSNSGSGSGGNIKLKATDITTGLVDSGANGNGNGGIIRLEASGNIATSTIVSNSNGSGNSGNITVISTAGSIDALGNSDSTSAKNIYAGANSGTAGRVSFQAAGNITLPAMFSVSNTGAGNDIKVISDNGAIDIQGDVATWASAGNAGDVKIEAKNKVKTGAVDAHSGQAVSSLVALNLSPSSLSSFSNQVNPVLSNVQFGVALPTIPTLLQVAPTPIPTRAIVSNGIVNNGLVASALASPAPTGSGNGGKVILISNQEDITASYVRSDSVGGTGGNIKITAAKSVKVTDSIAINDIAYSIYSSGNSNITINHGGIGNDLLVGDAGIDGISRAISSGDFGIFPFSSEYVFPGDYSSGSVTIKSPAAPLPPFDQNGDPTVAQVNFKQGIDFLQDILMTRPPFLKVNSTQIPASVYPSNQAVKLLAQTAYAEANTYEGDGSVNGILKGKAIREVVDIMWVVLNRIQYANDTGDNTVGGLGSSLDQKILSVINAPGQFGTTVNQIFYPLTSKPKWNAFGQNDFTNKVEQQIASQIIGIASYVLKELVFSGSIPTYGRSKFIFFQHDPDTGVITFSNAPTWNPIF